MDLSRLVKLHAGLGFGGHMLGKWAGLHRSLDRRGNLIDFRRGFELRNRLL